LFCSTARFWLLRSAHLGKADFLEGILAEEILSGGPDLVQFVVSDRKSPWLRILAAADAAAAAAALGFNLHKERGEGEELFVLGNIKYSPDVYVNYFLKNKRR